MEHPRWNTLLTFQDEVVNTVSRSSDNFVINVEDQPNSTNLHDLLVYDSYHHETTVTDNFLNNIREVANEVVGENQNNNSSNHNNYNNNNNNNDTDEISTEAAHISHELFTGLKKYIPFMFILFVKCLYDYRSNILQLIILFVTYNYGNNIVKREIAKQNNKSLLSLFMIICYCVLCIVFIQIECKINVFSLYTLIHMRFHTIWELLWSLLITDLILKLITIIVKVLLTCLPSKILPLRKRGKYFLVVEAVSQLYQCAIPMHLWISYFFECYQGAEVIFAVFISLLYMVGKGFTSFNLLTLIETAICKLKQNVNLGASPSKEQLVASGGICAVCHEQYSMPVRLHCKHIFCEACILTWLNVERSCPLCRATITDDPIYRDGHTSHFIYLY